MAMLLLTLLAVSQRIFPIKGQPMSPYCMEVCPLDGVLQRMIPSRTQVCQNLPLCPLVVSPHLMPCDVELVNIPHEFERWRLGKWKMPNIERIPWRPCLVGGGPQEMNGSSKTCQVPGKGDADFGENTRKANPSETHKLFSENMATSLIQNCTLDSFIGSSPMDTGNETATQTCKVTDFDSKTQEADQDKIHHLIEQGRVTNLNQNSTTYDLFANSGNRTILHSSQVSDENEIHNNRITSTVIHDESGWISTLCPSPMILYERKGQQHTNTTCAEKPGETADGNLSLMNTNITNSSAIKIECEAPNLVTLNCLACLLAKNSQNRTVNGTTLVKKLDNRLEPIEYLTVEAHISKNSSTSQIHTKLTKEQMAALEECLADGNKSEPYLVNGRPLIVKLQYLNQTEKQFALRKKTGHDFVISLPHEVEGKEDTNTNDPTTDQINLVSNYVTELEWMNKFEEHLTSTERSTTKGTREPKAALHNNYLPHTTDEPINSVNEEFTTQRHQEVDDCFGSFEKNEECNDDREDRDGILKNYEYLPLINQYYSKPNIAFTSSSNSAKPQSPNRGYSEQLERSASRLWKHRDYLPQQGVMNDQNDDQCMSYQTLKHGTRLNYSINCHALPHALNERANLTSGGFRCHPLHDRCGQIGRKNGVKYEKCRRIETSESAKGLQSRYEAYCHMDRHDQQPEDSSWECEDCTGSPRRSPEPKLPQYRDPVATHWHEDYYPQESQFKPENYIVPNNLRQWRRLPSVIQLPLLPCPEQMCAYYSRDV